jgi:hypothetical protein
MKSENIEVASGGVQGGFNDTKHIYKREDEISSHESVSTKRYEPYEVK